MSISKSVILYVDDDPQALDMISAGLEERGFSVIPVPGGKEALEKLETAVPALIIADLRMEPMNGFELYQQVKKNTSWRGIPFLFLTGVNDTLAKKYGMRLGVDAYITKPIEIADLAAIITKKLQAT